MTMLILATDMARHAEILDLFKANLAGGTFDLKVKDQLDSVWQACCCCLMSYYLLFMLLSSTGYYNTDTSNWHGSTFWDHGEFYRKTGNIWLWWTWWCDCGNNVAHLSSAWAPAMPCLSIWALVLLCLSEHLLMLYAC